jgi:type VI secretion system protein ImpH
MREAYAHFDWYQLVRLLLVERAQPDYTGTVESLTEPDSLIRFRADLSLAFPANEVTGVLDTSPDRQVTVLSPNYSVAGYLGPLPESLVEWLQERRAAGDRAMADFLDLFNHRIACLRYRARARLYPSLDPRAPQDTPWAARLAATMGLATPELTRQLPLPERTLLGLAGLLGNPRRNIDTLERSIACYFGSRVQVLPLCGAWHSMPASDQTRLLRQNSMLGKTTLLGSRLWDQAAQLEIRIGPLPYTQLCEFLPTGARFPALVGLLRFLTDRQVDCRVCLLTDGSTAPRATLRYEKGGAEKLGQTTWLGQGSQEMRAATFVLGAYAMETRDVA